MQIVNKITIGTKGEPRLTSAHHYYNTSYNLQLRDWEMREELVGGEEIEKESNKTSIISKSK
jgi:hypothetical protein